MNKLTQNEIIEALELIAKEFKATMTCQPKNNQVELHIEGQYIYSAVISDVAQKLADDTGYVFNCTASTLNSISGYISLTANKNNKQGQFKPKKLHYQFKLKEKISFYFNRPIKMMENPSLEYYLNEKNNSYILMLSTGDLSREKKKEYLEDLEKIREIVQTKKYEEVEISDYTLSEIEDLLIQIEKIKLNQDLNSELETKEAVTNHKL